MYIIIDANNNILSNGFGFSDPGKIEITEWPEMSPGQPYRKSDCKWNGSKVILKTEAEKAADKAAIKIFTDEQIAEINKLIDGKIK